MITIIEIKEEIEECRDKAGAEWEMCKRIAGHSAYGTGVEWGNYDMCCRLLEFINENE